MDPGRILWVNGCMSLMHPMDELDGGLKNFLLFIGNSENMFAQFMQSMLKEFEMNDNYLEKFKMDCCNAINTCCYRTEAVKRRRRKACELNSIHESHWKLEMLDNYNFTRPDILHGVALVSRYMETPKESHWLEARDTLNFGPFYAYGEDTKLVDYSDIDLGGDEEETKSTTGLSSNQEW